MSIMEEEKVVVVFTGTQQLRNGKWKASKNLCYCFLIGDRKQIVRINNVCPKDRI